jgi:hypothetical protein
VHDLGVEHGAVEVALVIGDEGEGRAAARRHHREPRRQHGDAVAMAHPHGLDGARRPDALGDGTVTGDGDLGAAELPRMAALDGAAEDRRHHLLAVADAEHRQAHRKHAFGWAGARTFRHAGRATREDDALGAESLDAGEGGRVGPDLAVDAGFAQAARNQLRHLAAEIEDQNAVVFHPCFHHDISSEASRVHAILSQRIRTGSS